MLDDRLSRGSQIAEHFSTRSAVGKLRAAFFAQAGESAFRYHIDFERVLAHLWKARSAHRRLFLQSVKYIDDVVHAIACIDDVGLAWADLGERYERALLRRCRGGQDEIEATIFVRRLFAQLRRRSRDDSFPALVPSLRSYGGNRPLRNWLADRLSAARARQIPMLSSRQPFVASGKRWTVHPTGRNRFNLAKLVSGAGNALRLTRPATARCSSAAIASLSVPHGLVF